MLPVVSDSVFTKWVQLFRANRFQTKSCAHRPFPASSREHMKQICFSCIVRSDWSLH
jgi:hypothetical protein